MSIILLLCSCLATTSSFYRVDGIPAISRNEDLEMERQLKLINKTPIKSIQTEHGFIVDCIDIKKQLAFDHPLLKNHKLQRKPSFQYQKQTKKTYSSLIRSAKIGLDEKDECPRGTVPVRRTTKTDLIRAKQLSNNTHILPQDNPGTHIAEVSLIKNNSEPYYGVSGTVSVYSPKAVNNQMSSGNIWVQKGEAGGLNKIYVGWQVFPQLYGDERTYFYTSWTADNFNKTGCYNLQCAGFVQTDRRITLGSPVAGTSEYGGQQSEMTISIAQDAKTSNWWLRTQNIDVGYFPASLFTNLASAELVGWGGRTVAPVNGPSPPMGSGYFPDDNFVHADYFRQITFKNESRIDYVPGYRGESYTDIPNCFGAKYYHPDEHSFYGYALQFGGPGGNCGI
ncbi:hypothetical protein L6164_013491 [Bauhinia variegata]|uniref:Uncharacterized protein n=1 Tax=Bauhinia variegata TaxID=167791 RepID=A0ACB9NFL4_BAUVA|nr:hypothetical protein L6164_013491 [Bauhinia variegata]